MDKTGSKEKKVIKALSFYKMETDEVRERYITPCFVNGLEAYDGEINLALDENFISDEYVVKLCLDYETRKGNKVVKKELIVALKGEIYFVKYIINPKEDDVESGVIFKRSFMRLVNGIVDFGSGVITVYLEEDPFKDDYKKTEKEVSPFVCKMWKSSCNKKREMENLYLFYPDTRTSSSTKRHLTQEEAAKEALALRISQKFALSDVLRITESDRDGEEEYKIKRNKFGAPIYGLKPAAYLNCNYPAERSLALQAVINPFRKISVWKKATMGGNDDEAESLRSKRYKQYETVEEDYWYDKIQKNDLWLLSMVDARHQNGYANVAWLIARWIKRKGAHTQKESQFCCRQFITKLVRKSRVLSDKGRLIPEDPQPGVPRVGISRPLRASMQDLYEGMSNMEIRKGMIERM
nr:hypothetical protein [Tanacetum cinerariifolium]